ncbi:Calcium-dependent phosphotriesterase [Venustampulla echinocandica]|uniref:Calcium-dependent phosphotriesterase n=1 Tax=Venustampulla echinocandica TaxID=2656787 RepID=A0A370TWI1_9HELO|nr:Calcium-dependent phosphotriesterase [Venustampulla echinocandica]RDL39886.1 Calcium-dependent phosphotriesterase [Venustampulla echinocandica]
MSTVTNKDIPIAPLKVQVVDRLAENNGSIKPPTTPQPQESDDGITLIQYSDELEAIVGPSPKQSLLLSTAGSSNNPFFHEACVYIPTHDELYITSNLLQSTTTATYPTILISRIRLTRSSTGNGIAALEWAKLRPPHGIDMPNGGVNYKDGILFCAQGSPSAGTGGLYYMPRNAPPKPVVTTFYGRDFNSVNDVVVSKRDGSIWFTDPCYGYEQGFRRNPELPCQAYRFDVNTGEVRCVADGFQMCNGIAFAPGEDVVYITDTGVIKGDGGFDLRRPATIYAFDVVRPHLRSSIQDPPSTLSSAQPYLTKKRVFAFAVQGVPDGIKCDTRGNVYAGCGDGIEVWNSDGCLLGRFVVPGGGGVANFCFGKEGEMFLCAEQRLWRVQLARETRGDLLDG